MSETYEETGSVDHLQDIEKPAIYSKRAIWGFSIFITPLFGGILLMQNLAAIDKKKQANLVFIISLVMTILAVLFATYFSFGGRTLNLGFNIGCAGVLAEYFHKKYFPDEAAYETRKIWKPLIIGIAIVILLTLLAIWAMDQPVQ